MKIITSVSEVERPRRRRVLVPTMGALHRAHGELMRVARDHVGAEGEVVVSIFVNPLQFEPGSDFERYPRPEQADEEFCRQAGVDLLFRPPAGEMYFDDRSCRVVEESLSTLMEGKARPGHFAGVCTVVAKLFNILRPDAAVFGEKDFQQLAIMRRMVRDLNYGIEIIAVPTLREADELAFSSRNDYLTAEERAEAPMLRRALLAAKESGKSSARELTGVATDLMAQAPLARIDYVELVDAETLQPIKLVRPNSLLAAAVYFGQTRLIDNIRLP